jgi:hypothetical protein
MPKVFDLVTIKMTFDRVYRIVSTSTVAQQTRLDDDQFLFRRESLPTELYDELFQNELLKHIKLSVGVGLIDLKYVCICTTLNYDTDKANAIHFEIHRDEATV